MKVEEHPYWKHRKQHRRETDNSRARDSYVKIHDLQSEQGSKEKLLDTFQV